MELEKQAHGVVTGTIPVVWDCSGAVRIYYPRPDAARWDTGLHPGPEVFAAHSAVPFLRNMWSKYNHLGSIPPSENGSAVLEPAKTRPCVRTIAAQTQWVMDTGSGHDLVPQQLIDASSIPTLPREYGGLFAHR